MSEEIKEILESYINHNEIEIILDRIKEIVDNEIIDYGEELSLSECKCLLNYITNLQKENQSLKNNYNDNEQAIHKIMEEVERLRTELNGYKSRNEKAVEYIKAYYLLNDNEFNMKNVLNILEGGVLNG